MLVQGMEPERRVELLLKGTDIDSPAKVAALKMHLCAGASVKWSAEAYGVDLSNFKKALARLNEVNDWVEDIKQIDWARFKKGLAG